MADKLFEVGARVRLRSDQKEASEEWRGATGVVDKPTPRLRPNEANVLWDTGPCPGMHIPFLHESLELLESKSPAAEPGFSPGDLVAGYDPTEPGVLRFGEFVRWVSANFLGEPYDGAVITGQGSVVEQLVTRDTIRLATPAASEETYGTMPKDDELPSELPAGTPTIRIQVPKCAIRLENRFGNGLGYWGVDGGLWYVDQIDWSRVKRPSPQPVPDALVQRCVQCGRAHGNGALCPFCADSGKRLGEQPGQSHPSVWGIPRAKEAAPVGECQGFDPQKWESTLGDHDARQDRLDDLRRSGHPLDRLAASRISYPRRERDGAEVGQHPEAWPSGAGEELYST